MPARHAIKFVVPPEEKRRWLLLREKIEDFYRYHASNLQRSSPPRRPEQQCAHQHPWEHQRC